MNQTQFNWLWNHMSREERERFKATVRQMAAVVAKAGEVLNDWIAAGVEQAEQHANGERP